MRPQATENDIDDWLDRLRRKDDAAAQATAVQAIYRGYYACVTAFVKLYVDQTAAVEEIVDDTFLAVFRKPDQFEGRSSFKTWLLSIAKNQCSDWMRRAKREPAHGLQDDEALLQSLVDPTWPVIDQLESKQISSIIRFCLQRLPDVQRQVIYWVFFEEMSVDQTAAQVQCAPGTVKSRVFHAKAKLAECINRRLNGGVA